MISEFEPMVQAGERSPRGGAWRGRIGRFTRPTVAAALAAIEVLAISLLFSFEVDVPYWLHPAYWLRQLQMLAIVAAVAWAIIMWPRRQEIVELWSATASGQSWRFPLLVNLLLFVALAVATVAFTLHAQQAASPPWGLFALFCVPLAATALSLVWLFAPPGFWKGLVSRFTAEIGIASCAGLALLVAGNFSQTAWEQLSGITLLLTYWLLGLYEPQVVVDFAERSLLVRDFQVIIDQSCSGYEGMALVTAFLGIYLWTFRSTLRFPNALLLLPLGIAAIFVLNIVRIAVLVSIGAHLSPAIAGGGFHSQAGWMSFLAVSLGLMALAPKVSFFAVERTKPAAAGRAPNRELDALIVPFMALMTGSILTAASAPFDTWLYGLKIVLSTAALAWFWRFYGNYFVRPSTLAVVSGLVVGIGWIVTDPGLSSAKGGDVGTFLAGLPAWLAVAWLVMRAVGGIVIVPIVEELAFRGLLYRWVISRSFQDVAFDRLSWVAVGVSSVLFGLLHSRPLAGAMAGVVFALVMVRTGRLTDAIASHIAANAIILAWAIAVGQWTLL